MSSPNLTIEIVAYQNEELINGHPTLSGTVILKPKESVTVDSMNVYLYLEVKGKMSPQVYTLKVINLFNYSKLLSRGQRYEFPFTFVVTDYVFSYAGKNAAIHHKIEVGLDINPEDYNKVNPGILSSLKKFVTNNTSIRSQQYFYFENLTKNYKVETSELTLKRNFLFVLALIFAVAFAGIGFFIAPEYSQLNTVLIILASLVLGFLTQLIYLHFSQTEIIVQLVNTEGDQFALKAIATSGKLSEDLEFYYEVVEEVIDGSGTTSTTYTTVRHKSAVQKIGTSIVEKDLVFEFPSLKNIPTISMESFFITWTMYATRKDTFGMDAVYESEFKAWLE